MEGQGRTQRGKTWTKGRLDRILFGQSRLVSSPHSVHYDFAPTICHSVSGTVQIAYAHARGDPTSDSFYTRQILYPVLVTVNHTLECHAMDLLPFSQVVTLPFE